MRIPLAALAVCAALWPALGQADALTLTVIDPKDGYAMRYRASWQRTPETAERYWLCDRPLWVPSGAGPRISRLFQAGYRVELVAGGDAAAPDGATGGDTSVLCTLADPAETAAPKAPAGEGTAAH
jgi:hypothetical protein